MAAKRRSTFARKGSKLETRAHAARIFKKVTRQWELALNVKCQIIHAVPGAECPNGGKIVLLNNAELQGSALGVNSNFPDAVRIRRLVGNIYFRPDPVIATQFGAEPCYEAAALNFRTTYMRAGLNKLRAPQAQAGIPDALNPLDNGASPYAISDYADGRWMRLWEHVWDPKGKTSGDARNMFSCCSVQAGYSVPTSVMTLGTGTITGYDVPEIVCQPCGDVEEPAVNVGCSFTYDVPQWWRLPINIGRTVVLKENDDLSLYFGWEKMREFGDVDRPVQPNMQFFGGVRMLMES